VSAMTAIEMCVMQKSGEEVMFSNVVKPPGKGVTVAILTDEPHGLSANKYAEGVDKKLRLHVSSCT